MCAAVILVAVALGCGPREDGQPAVSVTVKPDGKDCSISGRALSCAEVANYVQHVLRAKMDARIEVAGDATMNPDALDGTVEQLHGAGYTFVYGAIDFRQHPAK